MSDVPPAARGGRSGLRAASVVLLVLALIAFAVGVARSSVVLDYVSIVGAALAFAVVAVGARVSRTRPGRASAGPSAGEPPVKTDVTSEAPEPP